MIRLRTSLGLATGFIGLLVLEPTCTSSDEPVNQDGAGCLAPKQIIYTTPGCGAEAIPRCEIPNGDGCAMMVCLCDGVTTSGDGCGFSHEPYLYTGFCKRDAATVADAPMGGEVMDEVAIERPIPSDAPTVDALVTAVDAPTGMDGPRVDGHYFTIPDGRQFLEVPYCLPILSLESGARYCPSTLDQAQKAVLDALDAGPADALPYGSGRPELSRPCLEPLVAFLPQGSSLGWGASCYYDANSGALLSILVGSDTPTECLGSPQPNTAAFVAHVYGQYPTCTWPGQPG